MERFEYQMTWHPAEEFSKLIYFCTAEGACGPDDVPREEPEGLMELLNEQGGDGWELVQMVFRQSGLMVCWKRRLKH